MKKIVFLSCIFAMIMAFGTASYAAGVISKPEQMSTSQIDASYEAVPFLKNTLSEDAQVVHGDGNFRMHLFSANEASVKVNMAIIEMPDLMDSQFTSLQLVVNGRQQYICPIKLSYQVYNHPKLIDGKVVVKAFIGMNNSAGSHFYMVVDPVTGYGYSTEVEMLSDSK